MPGWDWPAELPPTTDRWFPARFHPANGEAWQGHRVTPYLNDLFVSVRDLDEWEEELIHPYTSSPWAEFFSGPAPHAEGDPVSPAGRPAVFLCNVDREPVTVALDPAWGGTVATRTWSGPAGDHHELLPRTIAMVT
jgi:hypothetical protein